MRQFENSSTGIDLRCDFPARESFREALLSRLLDMNESGQKATSEDAADPFDSELDMRELSDTELEMLAAAQGGILFPQELNNG